MDKFEVRSAIKLKFLEGKKPMQIYIELQETVGGSAPSLKTVYKWFNELKWGRNDMKDKHRIGRPKDVGTPEVITKIAQAVKNNPHISSTILANMMKISQRTVMRILRNDLELKKVSSKWVPKLLTKIEKEKRVTASRALLQQFQCGGDAFLQSIITQDETILSLYMPKSKQGAKVWLGAGDSAPEEPRIKSPNGRILMSIWWDCKGPILLKFYGKGETMKGLDYANEIIQLRKEIKQKRRGMLSNGVKLLFDNSPVHKANVSQDAIAECGFQVIDHPPYSPDLAPSDFWLFPQLKSKLWGMLFRCQEELELAVADVLSQYSDD